MASKRCITVFLASSLKHSAERELIERVLEEENSASLEIKAHLHEKDGKMYLRGGDDSQAIINAEADAQSAFMLLAGDRIGEKTIEEFENAVEHTDFTHHFIFVVHARGLMLENGKLTWEEFDRQHLHRGKIQYYETETVSDNASLEKTVRKIRRQLRDSSLVPLRPSELDYGRMLSSRQKLYRRSHGMPYIRRDVDKELAQCLHNGSLGTLTIITGTSLAGKTRAVINMMQQADEESTTIHFLRGTDLSAPDLLMGINPAGQFGKEGTHLLFIDEIDELLTKDPSRRRELQLKLFEICQYAFDYRENDSRHIHVIATATSDFNRLVKEIDCNAEPWHKEIRNIHIRPLSGEELKSIILYLRSLNLLSSTTPVRDGKPLGSLFVDMYRMRNIYNGLMSGEGSMLRKVIIDAVKTLWIWKRRHRGDFDRLVDFINGAYDRSTVATDISADEVKKALLDMPAFFHVVETAVGQYEFSVEDVFVEDLFNYEISGVMPRTGALLSAETAENRAVARIANYILKRHRDSQYMSLSKLVVRLSSLGQGDKLSAKLISNITDRILPLEKVCGSSEPIGPMAPEGYDWVNCWLRHIALHTANDKSLDTAERHRIITGLYRRRPNPEVLGALLLFEHANGLDSAVRDEIFDTSGRIRGSIWNSFSKSLTSAALETVTFQEGVNAIRNIKWLDWASINLRAIASRETVEEENSDDDFDFISLDDDISESVREDGSASDLDSQILNDTPGYIRHLLKECVHRVLPKAGSLDDVSRLIDAVKNISRAVASTGRQLFTCDGEIWFGITLASDWKTVAGRLDKKDLLTLHRDMAVVDAGGTDILNPLFHKKRLVLNLLLDRMTPPDVLDAYESLPPGYADSFTLRRVIESATAFPEAKGYIDNYMEQEATASTRLDDKVMNALLSRARSDKDIAECEVLYRSAGLLNESQSIYDTTDPYTMGILYNYSFNRPTRSWRSMTFQERRKRRQEEFRRLCQLMKRHRSEEQQRPVLTLGAVMKHAPGYEECRWLLYGDASEILTSYEQHLLATSPLCVSYLIAYVETAEQISETWTLIKTLIEQEQAGGEPMLTHRDLNIVNEMIKNRAMCPAFADVEEFLKRLKEAGLEIRENDFLRNALLKRQVQEMPAGSYERNALLDKCICAYPNGAARGTAMLFRVMDGHGKRLSYNELLTTRSYPIKNEAANWTHRDTSLLEFIAGLVRDGGIHPKIIEITLDALADGISHDADDARARMRSFIELVADNHVTIFNESRLRLLPKLEPLGIDIRNIVYPYSVISDVCARIAAGDMTYRQAEAYIEQYETTRSTKVHRSLAYYFTLLNSIPDTSSAIELLKNIMHLDTGRRVMDIIPGITHSYHIRALTLTGLPIDTVAEIIANSGLTVNDTGFYFLIRMCRDASDYKVVETAFPRVDGLHGDHVYALVFHIHDLIRRVTQHKVDSSVLEGFMDLFDNTETVDEWHEIYIHADKADKILYQCENAFNEYRRIKHPSDIVRRASLLLADVVGI